MIRLLEGSDGSCFAEKGLNNGELKTIKGIVESSAREGARKMHKARGVLFSARESIRQRRRGNIVSK